MVEHAPDYAIDAGGLTNVAQEVVSYDADKDRIRVLCIYDTILEICERAKKAHEPPHRVADALVEEILAAAT